MLTLNNNNNNELSSPVLTKTPQQQHEAPNLSVILTIRLLMQGKEVGSIIGKKGDHIKIIRDESGAKINISDGSCPERIVTITGNVETINKAFSMICRKFEEQLPNSVPKPPITLRLIVPATQCGSLIGKGGSKIREIREATGASIQVASEMLPNSTERAVTISGQAEAITTCMIHICQIMLESPPKGTTVPYRPKPNINPLLLASTAAAAAAAQQPLLQQQNAFNNLAASELTKIHPFNPLLHQVPGFNPAAVLAPTFTAAAGLYPSLGTHCFSHLAQSDISSDMAARIHSVVSKASEMPRQYAINAVDAQQKFAAASPEALGLSQYILNPSMQMPAEYMTGGHGRAAPIQIMNFDQTTSFPLSLASSFPKLSQATTVPSALSFFPQNGFLLGGGGGASLNELAYPTTAFINTVSPTSLLTTNNTSNSIPTAASATGQLLSTVVQQQLQAAKPARSSTRKTRDLDSPEAKLATINKRFTPY